MEAIPSIMAQNLLSPIVLSFALGLFASLARSSLSVPEAAAKALSLYLLFAIGFKGGASVAAHGLDGSLAASLVAGVALSFVIPFVAFGLLRAMTRLSAVDAAAVGKLKAVLGVELVGKSAGGEEIQVSPFDLFVVGGLEGLQHAFRVGLFGPQPDLEVPFG